MCKGSLDVLKKSIGMLVLFVDLCMVGWAAASFNVLPDTSYVCVCSKSFSRSMVSMLQCAIW